MIETLSGRNTTNDVRVEIAHEILGFELDLADLAVYRRTASIEAIQDESIIN